MQPENGKCGKNKITNDMMEENGETTIEVLEAVLCGEEVIDNLSSKL